MRTAVCHLHSPDSESHARRQPLPVESFFDSAIGVARGLLGKILVHRLGHEELRARIVETEAYLGRRDLAAHAAKGLTNRTRVIFGPPGHAYVYLIYGIHQMLNITCGVEGEAHCVLLRAAEPLDGLDVNLTGPGNLIRGLRIGAAHNGMSVCEDELSFLDDGAPPPRIGRAKRVGVDYSKHWKDRLLRFYDRDSDAVSRVPR